MSFYLRLAAAVAIFVSAHSYAQNIEGRFVKDRTELIGYWEMTQGYAVGGNANPYPAMYQYFAFYEDGGFQQVSASKPATNVIAGLDYARHHLPRTIQWGFKDGFMVVVRTDSPVVEFWGANISTKDVLFRQRIQVKEGDLFLSLDDGHGRARYYRWLRRLRAGR